MKKIMFTIALVLIFASNSIAQGLEANSESIVYVAKKTAIEVPVKTEPKKDFRYYYYPNMQAYFDIENSMYIYKDKGIWNSATELPPYYGGYSMYKNVKVKITDYIDDNPQQLVDKHKKLYPYVSKGRFTYKTEPSVD